jgi:hypothetical protein
MPNPNTSETSNSKTANLTAAYTSKKGGYKKLICRSRSIGRGMEIACTASADAVHRIWYALPDEPWVDNPEILPENAARKPAKCVYRVTIDGKQFQAFKANKFLDDIERHLSSR